MAMISSRTSCRQDSDIETLPHTRTSAGSEGRGGHLDGALLGGLGLLGGGARRLGGSAHLHGLASVAHESESEACGEALQARVASSRASFRGTEGEAPLARSQQLQQAPSLRPEMRSRGADGGSSRSLSSVKAISEFCERCCVWKISDRHLRSRHSTNLLVSRKDLDVYAAD